MAFRKWQKTSVKIGSLLQTAIGLVEIRKMERVNESTVTDEDAIKAGFSDKNQLLKSFLPNNAGTIFKISVSYYSEDPRIQLREQTELTDELFATLKQKLKRLDKFSKQGDWRKSVLYAIKDNPNPNLHATGIANRTGFEKEWLKRNIRKLKNIRLTISHTVRYELSPLGKIFVEKQETE